MGVVHTDEQDILGRITLLNLRFRQISLLSNTSTSTSTSYSSLLLLWFGGLFRCNGICVLGSIAFPFFVHGLFVAVFPWLMCSLSRDLVLSVADHINYRNLQDLIFSRLSFALSCAECNNFPFLLRESFLLRNHVVGRDG